MKSEFSSKFFFSSILFTISLFVITNIIGIPIFVFNKPSFKGVSNFKLISSSDKISLINFPSSSNFGSTYN